MTGRDWLVIVFVVGCFVAGGTLEAMDPRPLPASYQEWPR